mmetsp:Transcript_3302/g.6206  ORF Transcript_3302/g.6206 Transcript_3302/m.6206 type:complete len:83 (+) Transcript_3302:1921-2169(+)
MTSSVTQNSVSSSSAMISEAAPSHVNFIRWCDYTKYLKSAWRATSLPPVFLRMKKTVKRLIPAPSLPSKLASMDKHKVEYQP